MNTEFESLNHTDNDTSDCLINTHYITINKSMLAHVPTTVDALRLSAINELGKAASAVISKMETSGECNLTYSKTANNGSLITMSLLISVANPYTD
jgi:hypothetical protein